MDSQTEKLKLETYSRDWKLSDPALLAKTATSCVYKVTFGGEPAVLKLLTEEGVRDEGPGAVALEYFAGKASVKLLRSDANAHLLEFVDGPNLVAHVNEGRDTEATEILCHVLKQLHSHTEPLPDALVPLSTRFESLLKYSGSDKLIIEGANIARELLRSGFKEVVLHGDLHHENVIKHPQRGWLAIDPKGLRGEATFDAANIVYNPVSLPMLARTPARVSRTCTLISERMGFEEIRFLRFAFAYGALSAVWCMENEQSPAQSIAVAKILRGLI